MGTIAGLLSLVAAPTEACTLMRESDSLQTVHGTLPQARSEFETAAFVRISADNPRKLYRSGKIPEEYTVYWVATVEDVVKGPLFKGETVYLRPGRPAGCTYASSLPTGRGGYVIGSVTRPPPGDDRLFEPKRDMQPGSDGRIYIEDIVQMRVAAFPPGVSP